MHDFLAMLGLAETGSFWSSVNWPFLWAGLVLVVDNIIRIVALFVVPRNRRPTSGMAWLITIFWLPVPGLILFLLIGGISLPKKRREMQELATEVVSDIADREQAKLGTEISLLPDGISNAVQLGRSLGAQPMVRGNATSICIDYEESFARIASAIREAKNYVYVEFYILVHDDTTHDVFEAMREAIARGVEVRVLLDHISAVRNPGAKRTAQTLDEIGARWAYLLPIRPWRGEWQRPDLRNHRKLVVIDGTVGFMGSQNLVDSSYNKKANIRRGLHWRDLMVRVDGPAALGLEAVFLSDWFVETGEVMPQTFDNDLQVHLPGNVDCQILPSGPGFGRENNLQVFVSLLYTAQERISITSPYFIPESAIMHALRAATARGVQVELFVSEIGDQAVVYHAQRSYYEELFDAGVRIFMYRPPYILHSKHFTIDDKIAVVGSSNMDQRSFNLNMEVSMVVYGESFVRELDQVNAHYHANSRELTAEEWSKQPLRSQLLDGLARLTSALQ
ncbi:cardiolipin synthase [Leucobacter sp. UT-8R-CII-1-4]|uniref:cardiolipin synthase n=1 Tax=Leucobacter sp. UT-8R-CII-1-4 TaxID=3040075 RepID=UPI0024A97955|nr:cardiolipin synthase [Leucobacter sp. UT-8R-CII-1-4]MDI6023836.1 cardiolipin synthase [Leucobacter sp. UT-8R-CII-1-4]